MIQKTWRGIQEINFRIASHGNVNSHTRIGAMEDYSELDPSDEVILTQDISDEALESRGHLRSTSLDVSSQFTALTFEGPFRTQVARTRLTEETTVSAWPVGAEFVAEVRCMAFWSVIPSL
jgi:hypothetical protein